jgi:hypothetical protein
MYFFKLFNLKLFIYLKMKGYPNTANKNKNVAFKRPTTNST